MKSHIIVINCKQIFEEKHSADQGMDYLSMNLNENAHLSSYDEMIIHQIKNNVHNCQHLHKCTKCILLPDPIFLQQVCL